MQINKFYQRTQRKNISDRKKNTYILKSQVKSDNKYAQDEKRNIQYYSGLFLILNFRLKIWEDQKKHNQL